MGPPLTGLICARPFDGDVVELSIFNHESILKTMLLKLFSLLLFGGAVFWNFRFMRPDCFAFLLIVALGIGAFASRRYFIAEGFLSHDKKLNN